MRNAILAAFCCLALLLAGFSSMGRACKDSPYNDTFDVKATIYKPSMGTQTASGFKINPRKAQEHRLIAVSWDLRRLFPFGTRVMITGCGPLDGLYVVRDLMAKRWKRKIDILVDERYKLVSFKNVKLTKYSPDPPPDMEL